MYVFNHVHAVKNACIMYTIKLKKKKHSFTKLCIRQSLPSTLDIAAAYHQSPAYFSVEIGPSRFTVT